MHLKCISAESMTVVCTVTWPSKHLRAFPFCLLFGGRKASIHSMEGTWRFPLLPGPEGHKCAPWSCDSRTRIRVDVAGLPAPPKFPSASVSKGYGSIRGTKGAAVSCWILILVAKKVTGWCVDVHLKSSSKEAYRAQKCIQPYSLVCQSGISPAVRASVTP